MSKPPTSSRSWWRVLLRWSLAIVVLLYALTDVGDGGGDDDDDDDDGVASVVASGPAHGVIVAELETTRVSPGGAVVVQVSEAGPADDSTPVEAIIRDETAELLYRRDGQHVFKIPTDMEDGPAALWLRRGEWRSSLYKIEIGPAKRRKFLRNLIGGLALVLLGLRTLSRGLRRYIGTGLRRHLARLTANTPGSLGLGVVLGGLLQATTSAAGMLIGLLDAKALGLVAAFAMLLGAQLGAGFTGALLPLAGGREGLLIVALGVGWLMLVADRRQRGLAELVLGLGLLFHGLQLVRIGANTLVDDPDMLAYLQYLDADTVLGTVACVGAGALSTALLQGPGPAFVLVMGLAESSGLLTIDQCLAILAGAPLGSALGTTAVASAFGREGARLARWHVVFGLAATAALAATVGLWAGLAESWLGTSPHEVAYGKKLLYPNVGGHLTLAFIVSQLIVTTLALPVVRLVSRRSAVEVPGERSARQIDVASRLRDAIEIQRAALSSCLALSMTGQRQDASVAERELRRSREAIETLLRDRVASVVAPLSRVPTRGLALALLQLQGAAEALLLVGDRGVERAMGLSEADREFVQRIHDLVIEGIADVDAGIARGDVDLGQARRREIRINGIEADVRRQLAGTNGSTVEWRRALFVSELVGAYESIGNQLFRLLEGLRDDPDDF